MSDHNGSLLIRDDSQLQVIISASATERKETALATASLVVKVSSPIQERMAVDALAALDSLLKEVEAARILIKAPILDFGRTIDKRAKDFIADLQAQKLRISKALGDYKALEDARTRSIQAARVAELNEIERNRQLARASAASIEELDLIDQRANEEVAAIAPVPVSKTPGVAFKDDWDIEITDPGELAAKHPSCVRIEPKLGEIKALLNAGVTVAGIVAKPKIKVQVRAKKEIEV